MKRITLSVFLIHIFCFFVFAQDENQICPKLAISVPKEFFQSGEPMFFSALIDEKVKEYVVEYNWSVDKGTIVKGKNADVVQIETLGLYDKVITATLEIKGLPENCANKISEKAVVAPLPISEPLDDYGKIPLLEELMRIDNFLISLQENPDYKGYVWIYTTEKENLSNTKKHIKRLIKHIKFRKFEAERITFVIEKDSYQHTQLLSSPPDAKISPCENCEIIKSSDFK